jgi:hypothetical protein
MGRINRNLRTASAFLLMSSISWFSCDRQRRLASNWNFRKMNIYDDIVHQHRTTPPAASNGSSWVARGCSCPAVPRRRQLDAQNDVMSSDVPYAPSHPPRMSLHAHPIRELANHSVLRSWNRRRGREESARVSASANQRRVRRRRSRRRLLWCGDRITRVRVEGFGGRERR